MKASLRALCPLLLGLLASCTVYNNIFHPYRLPSPPMSKEAKAKARAAEKARHKGTSLKPAETADETTTPPDPATPGGTAPTAAKADNKLTYNELPTGTKLKYDKLLLLKKPKLRRRQYHHYDTHPLKPNRASRESRRLRHHAKGEGKGDKRDDAPVEAAPVEASPPAPSPTPTPAPEPKAKKEQAPAAPKPPKAKKVRLPKPDPTQQNPDH